MRASMFAYAIFVVTNVFTDSFASSALTKLMRATGAAFSTVRRYTSSSAAPARSSDSPTRRKSGLRKSWITLPRAMNSGL